MLGIEFNNRHFQLQLVDDLEVLSILRDQSEPVLDDGGGYQDIERIQAVRSREAVLEEGTLSPRMPSR